MVSGAGVYQQDILHNCLFWSMSFSSGPCELVLLMLYVIMPDVGIASLSHLLCVPKWSCCTILMFQQQLMGQWVSASEAVLVLSMAFMKHRLLFSMVLSMGSRPPLLARKMYLWNNLYQRKEHYIYCVFYLWLPHLLFCLHLCCH